MRKYKQKSESKFFEWAKRTFSCAVLLGNATEWGNSPDNKLIVQLLKHI